MSIFIFLLVSVVVWFEGACLGEPHVLGLFLAQLSQVGFECAKMKGSNELVHELGHEIHVSLVASTRRVKQLNQCKCLKKIFCEIFVEK